MTPIDIAEGFLGYKEGKNNDTIFGKWFGLNNNPYCMMFVQYCFAKADKPLHYKTASCSVLLNWYKMHKPETIVKKPRANDIVIFNFGHTGIVVEDKGTSIVTIEANTSPDDKGSQNNGQGVYKRTRPKTKVTAYIRPYEELEDTMTGQEIYIALSEYLKDQTLPNWAKKEFQEAIDMGLTDGSNPCGLIPRYQAVILAKRAAKGK